MQKAGAPVPVLHRGEVKLVYYEAGNGDPPLVLLHGWGANRSYLAPQFQYFQTAHRVLSMDLRGHGESDKPDQAYTIEKLADDAAWLCRQLDVTRPVLVGHSMGGSIALELAANHAGLYPSAVVILEALVVAPPALIDQFRPVLDGVRSPAYAEVMRQFMDQLFGPHYDRSDKERRLNQLSDNPQNVMVSALESVLAYDSTASVAACRLPILYVSSGPWYTDVNRFKQLCPHLVTAQTVGAGHNFPLEIPEQLNPMIARFLEIYVK
jgi:pimeloyl-ACP methyl ester carboxylesterase